ncbi:MAG: polysaccharide deacetylase family protein [Sphingobacteriales bacterium]|nr:polysaccharide deacetylase family protein [Sphingobacteriales bacterium]
MLNFKTINIFFVALLIQVILFNVRFPVPWYTYLLLVFVYSLILFYGCYYIGSNFFIKVICSAETTKKQIALTFDDGPAENYTPEILQILKANKVKAAFFCIGNRVKENPALVKQLHTEGHVIGNHSYSHHFWFDLFSTKKVLADLQLMDAATKEAIGLQPKLFRPPYGVTNPNIKRAIIKGNYTPIGWNVRSMDTVIKDEKKLLDKIVKDIQPGAIFLFHDTSKATVNILPAFVKKLKEDGYEIVRLDKMLHLQPYA